MPCGKYAEMARGMGFDCSRFSDDEKTAFAQEVEQAIVDGSTAEDAVRAVVSRVNASRVNNPSMVDGFDAEWTPEGHMILKDVPVFLPTEKKGHEFTKAWMKAALKDAQQGEADGYLPPMHVKHHGSGEEVTPAGMFRMTEIQPRTFKGRKQPMLLVDKIFTNPDVIEEVLAGRLPYRSVEIFDATKEKIDSLSLLDHEAPFLELPITKVRAVSQGTEEVTESVEPSTFLRDWTAEGCEADSPFVAYFARGNTFAFLMEKPMGTEYSPVEFQKDPEEEAAESVADDSAATAVAEETEETEAPEENTEPFGGEETPEEEAAEAGAAPDMGSDNAYVQGIIGAIISGDIAVKDLHAIQKAIASVEGDAHGEEPSMAGEEKKPEEIKEEVQEGAKAAPPPPLASPGEAMSREVDEETAALMGRVEGLEAWKADRQRDDEIRTAVDEALASMEGRALGENPRDRFTAFARQHGVPAFKAYAEDLAKELPPVSASRFAENPGAFDFGKSLPDEVLKFQKDGPEAVEAASKHAGMYEALKSKGMVNVSLERYLDINMNGLGGEK